MIWSKKGSRTTVVEMQNMRADLRAKIKAKLQQKLGCIMFR